MWTLILLLASGGCTPDEVSEPDRDFACGPTHAWQRPDPAYGDLRAHFEERFAESGLQGAAMALMKDGVIVFAAASGERDPLAGAQMTVRTRSRNGSTLKMQTATALLHQQDLGVLSVEDGLHDWMPGLDLALSPGHMDGVTLHLLLSHQGGFYDYTPVEPTTETAEDHAYGFFADNVYALAPAGSFFNYSNPNFALAGLVASEAANTDYDTLMQETVFEPLCMSRATFDPEEVAADGVWATVQYPDYFEGDGELVWATPESFGHPFSRPAGLAWMSVLDLLHFQYFLMEGDDAVLSDAARAALVTPHVPVLEAGDHSWYGYGVFVHEGFQVGDAWYDETLWEHSGGLLGYTTLVYTLPHQRVSVAILQVGDGWLADVALGALLDATDLTPGTPPEVPYDLAVLDAAAGSYVDPFNVGPLEVTRVGDALHIEAPLLDEYDVPHQDTLHWYGHANFLWVIQGSTFGITFVDDDGDLGNGYRWLRNRIFVAERGAPTRRALVPGRRPHLEAAPLRASGR